MATASLSAVLLPSVATGEELRRISRTSTGGVDSEVFSSYAFAQRFRIYAALGTNFPDAHYLVATGDYQGENIEQMLLAFGKAGQVSEADDACGHLNPITVVDALVNQFSTSEELFQWKEESPNLAHQIIASHTTTTFVVLPSLNSLYIIESNAVADQLDCMRNDH